MNSLSEKSHPAFSDCATASSNVILPPACPSTMVRTPPRSETTNPWKPHCVLRMSVSKNLLMLFGTPLMAL